MMAAEKNTIGQASARVGLSAPAQSARGQREAEERFVADNQLNKAEDLDRRIERLETRLDEISNESGETDTNHIASAGGVVGHLVADRFVLGIVWATGDLRVAHQIPLAGWLRCTGQEVNVEDYPDLFGVIGQRYGQGGTADLFNLPSNEELGEPPGKGSFWLIRT